MKKEKRKKKNEKNEKKWKKKMKKMYIRTSVLLFLIFFFIQHFQQVTTQNSVQWLSLPRIFGAW